MRERRGRGRQWGPTCSVGGGDGALQELILLAQDVHGGVGLALALGGRGFEPWGGRGEWNGDQCGVGGRGGVCDLEQLQKSHTG